jgi:hypothetical protein
MAKSITTIQYNGSLTDILYDLKIIVCLSLSLPICDGCTLRRVQSYVFEENGEGHHMIFKTKHSFPFTVTIYEYI